jgi:hypothetical protein
VDDQDTEQTRYAMCRLLDRLVVEGYIRDDRVAELKERVSSLEAGRGFTTKKERTAQSELKDLLS